MLTFIFFIIIALVFGIFATQNTQGVTITLGHLELPRIPLYIVMGVSLVIGLAISWINGLFDTFFASMQLRGKDNAIKDKQLTIQQLEKKLDKLEEENARLRGENKSKTKVIDTDRDESDSITNKIRNILPKK